MRFIQMQFKEIQSNMMTSTDGVTRLMELIQDIVMEEEKNSTKRM